MDWIRAGSPRNPNGHGSSANIIISESEGPQGSEILTRRGKMSVPARNRTRQTRYIYNMIPENLLLGVRKPAQYIGQEWNVSRKDFQSAEIKFGLCFPDLYEVGMSNLGLRIIYGLLNAVSDVACERFFAPALDMEGVLRSSKRQIVSLESEKELRDFDFIGFSLGYELNYTNVLNILDLGAVPLEASSRNHIFPLIIGGGPCVLNPEPLHDFFDLFLIGEAEEALPEIIQVYRRYKEKFKQGQISKEELLLELSAIGGVYVPSFYEPFYDSEGRIQDFKIKVKGAPLKVKKRFIQDLDKSYYPQDWLVPYVEIVHDRITLEIMRGCPNHCNFCQARAQYFPLRLKSLDNVFNLAAVTYCSSGYEEISLGGLSVSDYPRIEELLNKLIGLFKEKGVSVSLPSIKSRLTVGNLASLLATIKKTGLTFAPEAASEKLQQVLNKDFNKEDFFRNLEQSFSNGYRHVKLYFMIGLPQEEYSDLDAIVDLAMQVSGLRKKVAGGSAQVNISINTLIPKPHTPFQWLAMEGLGGIKDKQAYLRNKVRSPKIKVHFHNSRMSFLEGVFSRGDRRLSAVILAAFRKGARFDGWDDHFIFERWEEAFRECGLDPNFYLRQKDKNETLPWDLLDVGINKETLQSQSPDQ